VHQTVAELHTLSSRFYSLIDTDCRAVCVWQSRTRPAREGWSSAAAWRHRVTSSTSGLRRSFCSSRCPCGCPSVCRRPGQAVSTRRSHNSSIVGGGWVRHDNIIVNCRSTDSERPHHRCCQLPNNCVSRQMFPTLHDGLENFSPGKNCHFLWGDPPPSQPTTWFSGLTGVQTDFRSVQRF